MASVPLFDRVAIVGCGLIGGSLALAARAAGVVREVVVTDRDPSAADRAVALGIGDRAAPTASDAVVGADLVVIGTPVAQVGAILRTIAPVLARDAVITDVGSTKRDVVAAAAPALGDAFPRFVPGHPIAGREVHGPDAALADLFRDKRVLLTPHDRIDADALACVEALWTACGARVSRLDATAHDQVLSAVSHLPHLLAYLLVAQIADAADASLKFDLAGGGFRDFTRIAASSPEMWSDIAIANRDALLDDLDDYRARLDALRASVAASDRPAIEALFTKASIARGAWGRKT